jgi:hypothetical protein
MRLSLRFASAVVALTLLQSFALAETSPTPSAPAATGIEGLITISPVHGGPIRQGVDSSAPLPKTAFVVRQGERIVTKFVTDEEGRFRIALPPGNYEVLAEDQRHKFGGYGPWPVEVVGGEMAKVHWDCDSGLR